MHVEGGGEAAGVSGGSARAGTSPSDSDGGNAGSVLGGGCAVCGPLVFTVGGGSVAHGFTMANGLGVGLVADLALGSAVFFFFSIDIQRWPWVPPLTLINNDDGIEAGNMSVCL